MGEHGLYFISICSKTVTRRTVAKQSKINKNMGLFSIFKRVMVAKQLAFLITCIYFILYHQRTSRSILKVNINTPPGWMFIYDNRTQVILQNHLAY